MAWTYGLACHLLFVAGVGSMIVVMHGGMTKALGILGGTTALTANLILLLQFPILHSLLLTRRGSRMLKLLAPSPWGATLATTSYAAVASLQVALLFLGWSPSGTVWWRAGGLAWFVLNGLYAGSWLLLGRAIVDAGLSYQVGALGWRALAIGQPVCFPPMPVTGLFRWCRQPIYVAFALTLWTVPVWTPDQLLVATVLTAYCLLGPLLKERRFAWRFGSSFVSYQRNVPYWLPSLRPWPRQPAVSPYNVVAQDWWSGRIRWLRVLHALVPVRLKLFSPLVGDWAGRRVLDLGCGGGFMAEALATQRARVTGIDPEPAVIEAARLHARESDLPIDYRVGRGERILSEDGCFDVVVCVDVLEHVEDIETVLGEVARVLRPGGLFLFDTINRTWLAAFLLVTLGERVLRLVPQGTHDPTRFVSPAELRSALAKAGLVMGPLSGLGPGGMTRHGDLLFRRWPTRAVLYLGSARKLSA